jgi:HAD superfamily hydrolase (TIGR01509 family)
MTPTLTPRPPKALLFDLDDTLWPIAPVIVAAEASLHEWMRRHAPRVAGRYDSAALREHRMAMLAGDPGLKLDLSLLRRASLLRVFAEAGEDGALVEHAIAHFLAQRNRVSLYDDVLPFLEAVGPHLLLGAVTNGNADLGAIGLAPHFKVMLSAPAFGRAKPDPAIFLAACEALQVAPHDTIYVGDDVLLDVRGAQCAGLRAVWLNRQGSAAHLEHAVQPDLICENLAQLQAWLAAQGGALRA